MGEAVAIGLVGAVLLGIAIYAFTPMKTASVEEPESPHEEEPKSPAEEEPKSPAEDDEDLNRGIPEDLLALGNRSDDLQPKPEPALRPTHELSAAPQAPSAPTQPPRIPSPPEPTIPVAEVDFKMLSKSALEIVSLTRGNVLPHPTGVYEAPLALHLELQHAAAKAEGKPFDYEASVNQFLSTVLLASKAGQASKVRREPEGYPVGLVGEQSYQDAIGRSAAGETATLLREPDNPYDDEAIVVVSARSETIGYIPRDSFVQDVVHEQDKGCTATILSIEPGARGFQEVVLDLTIGGEPIGERAFQRT